MGIINDFTLNATSPVGQFAQTYTNLQPMQQAIQQKKARKAEEERQIQYGQLFNTALEGNDPKAWMRLMEATPQEERESMQNAWGGMTEMQQQAVVTPLAEMASAALSGNMDMVYASMKDQAAAYDASGDTQKANAIRETMHKAMQDPNGTQALTGQIMRQLAAVPGSQEVLERLYSVSGEAREEAASEMDMMKIITDPKYGFVTDEQKADVGALMEGRNKKTAEAIADSLSVFNNSAGGLSATDISNLEMAHRKEFKSNIDPYVEVVDAADKLFQTLNGADTGLSDYAAVKLFQTLFDSSVVRESEVAATAEFSAGRMTQLHTMMNNMVEGDLVETTGRMDMLRLAEIYLNSANEGIDKEMLGMDNSVSDPRFGMSRKNVFQRWYSDDVFNGGRTNTTNTPAGEDKAEVVTKSPEATEATLATGNTAAIPDNVDELEFIDLNM